MNPQTFDKLTARLDLMTIFHNNSGHEPEQILVERQLFIALEKFETHGNGASIQRMATWAGIGYETINIITRRVITAILSSDLQRKHVRWPAKRPEKKHAKDWAKKQSDKEAWREG